MVIAVATPVMLPVPTVDASAVATAWNGVTPDSPFLCASGPNKLPAVCFITVPNLRI